MSKGVFPSWIIIVLIALALISGCATEQDRDGNDTQTQPGEGPGQGAQQANPAAEYCVGQGNRYSITKNSDGSETGYCTLKTDIVCEEWAYMRGDCGSAGAPEPETPPTYDTPAGSCAHDSDCVPSGCCHPTSCTNIPSKKPCNVMCTMECRPNTLDCGQGSCRCIDGSCKAVYDGSTEVVY